MTRSSWVPTLAEGLEVGVGQLVGRFHAGHIAPYLRGELGDIARVREPGPDGGDCLGRDCRAVRGGAWARLPATGAANVRKGTRPPFEPFFVYQYQARGCEGPSGGPFCLQSESPELRGVLDILNLVRLH